MHNKQWMHYIVRGVQEKSTYTVPIKHYWALSIWTACSKQSIWNICKINYLDCAPLWSMYMGILLCWINIVLAFVAMFSIVERILGNETATELFST